MLTFKEENKLSDLYENFHEKKGWLSWMSETLFLSTEEIQWLGRRDDQQKIVDDKLKAWEREIERSGTWSIYGAENDHQKLVLINLKITALEREADTLSGKEAFLFREMSELGKLEKLRQKVRGRLIHQVFEEAVDECPEWLICQAREVPLRDIIERQGQGQNRYILCPFHREKSPSFYVGKWGYCFGCGAWADSIKWCITQRSMTFVEAVKYLANLIE